MKATISLAAVLSSALLVSASPKPASSSVQACTTTIDKLPPLAIDCTFKSHTATSTSSVDCGGCAYVSTVELGVGLPCQTVTTVPGTTTVVETSCLSSATYSPASTSSSPPPAPTCTTTVGPAPSLDLSPTLITYKTTKTKTSSVSCGGCAIATRRLGPGPVRHITTTQTKKVTTTTTYVCATPSKH